MKAVTLLQNRDERFLLRSFLKEFENVRMFKDFNEFLTDLNAFSAAAQLYILDDRCENIVTLLESLKALTENQNPPLILMLVREENQDVRSHIEQSERLRAYADLGVETFLHRPFGGKELKAKIEECTLWAKNLPAWLKLLRAGKALLKAKEYKRTIDTLGKLHELMPENLNVALVLSKSLVQSEEECLREGLPLLKKLTLKFPNNPTLRHTFIASLVRLNEFDGALNESLAWLRIDADETIFGTCLETCEKLYAQKGDLRVFVDLLELLKLNPSSENFMRRVNVFGEIALRLEGAQAETQFRGLLTQNADLGPHVEHYLERFKLKPVA